MGVLESQGGREAGKRIKDFFLKMFTMVRLQTDNGTSLSYKCDKLDKWVSKMGMKDMLEGKAWRRAPILDYLKIY